MDKENHMYIFLNYIEQFNEIYTITNNNPTQETSPNLSTEQASSQSTSPSWLIPALIVGAVFLLNKQ